MAKSWEKTEFKKTLALMMTSHPKAFYGKDSPETKPLKRGIHHDLISAHPELNRGKIHRFVSIYCGKNRYVSALARGCARIDLEGNEVEQLRERDIEHAQSMMAARAAEYVVGGQDAVVS